MRLLDHLPQAALLTKFQIALKQTLILRLRYVHQIPQKGQILPFPL